MDVQLSEDQEFFRTTTRKFLEERSPLTSVRALEDDPDGFDRAYWSQGAELGWTSMLVPERDGGGSLSGDGLCDLAIIAEEMGRLVAPGPLVPVSVVADAVGALGDDQQRADVLGEIVSGGLIAAWAYDEAGMRSDPRAIKTTATDTGNGYVFDGEKTPVEAAAQSDRLLVTARLVGGASDGALAQFLIPTDTVGLTIVPLDSVDLTRRFASVRFVRASVPGSTMLGDVTAAPDQIERQLQIAIVLQCAETCGAMARAFEFTVEYMQDRFSFGRPIASYQALKHRVADIKMWLEASHATTDAAARAVSAGDVDAGELAGAAKAYVGPVASEIIQDCVQLHGGIGVTWEHDLHLYLRRVTINHSTYGSPNDHLERIARDIGLTATTPGAIR